MVHNEIELEKELNQCCENILNTKNTFYLNDFHKIVNKTLLDKKILCRTEIIKNLNKLKGLIPSKFASELLNKAIEINDLDVCIAYLNNIQIVNETDAINCLKFFIKFDNKNDDKELNVNQINKNLENHLNLLFAMKYDYSFLTKEIKKLSSSEFILCLNYLKLLLRRYFGIETNTSLSKSNSMNVDEDENNQKQQQHLFKTPDFLQVTELLSCFVDAHFTHITLSHEAQEIIADLLQMVESQVDIFSDIISIESLINEAKNKSNVQKTFDSNQGGNYYIEVLKL